MKIDDVKVLEALFEAARRHGVRRLEVDDVAVEFRADAPAQEPTQAPALMAGRKPIFGLGEEEWTEPSRSAPLDSAQRESKRAIEHMPIPKPGTGDLCHCGHSKAIEHNHLGCLIGCDETQCRGEESEAKE